MWWNNSSAFPVGGQSCGPRSCRWGSAGCLDLVVWLKSSGLFSLGGSVQAKWCEAASCIFSSGGPKMTFRPMLRNETQSGQIFKHEQICAQKDKSRTMWCSIYPDDRYSPALSLDQRPTRWYDFSARMRNMGQLIRWMEFLSQTNRLSNWGGSKHPHAL